MAGDNSDTKDGSKKLVMQEHKKNTKKMACDNSDTKDGSKKLVRQEHKKMTKQ